jgi:hypothetical protein
MGRPMVSAGDEVSASLLAGYATAGDIGLYRQAGCSPSATEGSPPSVTHGRDINNFLSIGRPQAHSHDVAEVPSPRGSQVQRRTPVDDEQLSWHQQMSSMIIRCAQVA